MNANSVPSFMASLAGIAAQCGGATTHRTRRTNTTHSVELRHEMKVVEKYGSPPQGWCPRRTSGGAMLGDLTYGGASLPSRRKLMIAAMMVWGGLTGLQSFTPPPISWRLTGLASLAGAANWGLA